VEQSTVRSARTAAYVMTRTAKIGKYLRLMGVYWYSVDRSKLGLLKILLRTNAIAVSMPKSLNVHLSSFVTLCIAALSY